MYINHEWRGLKDRYGDMVVGLGNFDGVHVGHQKLISELVKIAKTTGSTPVVFTFNPHPLEVLNPGKRPPLLLSQAAKQNLIAELGVEVLLQVPFDLEFAGQTPENFVKTVLHDEMRARGIVVGYNYTFGYQGKGTPALLQELASIYHYDLRIMPPVMVEGQVVSSTLIRNLVLIGKVDEAAKFLGYYPFVEGQVVTGKKRGGSSLGFPTANLNIDETLLVPANGVYLVKICIEGDNYMGLANIGTKPTFQDKTRNIEVHLIDFNRDLYGENIKVSFTKKLREEKQFKTPSDLIKQIKKDISRAREEWFKAENKKGQGSI
ncbi:MAG: FAD synthase [Pelotomaculum thermopropionicum]|uniref:Riboflavin biosynthesis protein n=1 Tax=Pelotomaculum thermopropionicum TaxID=110500 RepID=A0A117M4L8_9FIRM|nr:MAG: FAD synthase [Pelotomaculum thermopropionicum]